MNNLKTAPAKNNVQRVKLRFNWKKFNPNFHHLEREMKDLTRRFIWCYGGSSSAKSYSIAQAILIIAALIEGSDTLVFRNVSATLEDTIYKDFVNVINTLRLNAFFKINFRKITCINGAVIVFKGLDDDQKIKGISGFKRVVYDEISEGDFTDFKQLRKRLRGREGQQLICSFNPIDEEHWINKEIFTKQKKVLLSNSLVDRNGILRLDIDPVYTEVAEKWEGAPITIKGVERPSNIVVIKSTYLNNFWVVGAPCGMFGFVDDQAIADFEYDRLHDWDFYNVYGLGNWGVLNKGGEMYKNFIPTYHVAPEPVPYDSGKSLHLTFDENVNPWMTLDIWQGDSDDNSAVQIDEICLEDPQNTLKHTMTEFRNRYPANGMTVFIYGDATSKKQDVKLEKGVNFFVLVENILKTHGYITARRVPSSNPNVELRCNWLNEVFNGYDGIKVLISPVCTKTVNDYKYLKQASDGGKHKEKEKNKVTGITFEKYGHNTDANDYFLTQFFYTSFTNFGKPKNTGQTAVMTARAKKNRY